MQKNIKDIKVLINNKNLLNKIKETAEQINLYYDENEILNVICVLKGAVMFFTELTKHLKMPIKMHFVTLSSYGNSQKSTGKVTSIDLNLPKFKNQKVLIIEDIIDTGLTLSFFSKIIKEECLASDVKIATMFDKKCARTHDIKPDFSAFDIDNKFIVGFGLDYCELFRNLDYIGYFE